MIKLRDLIKIQEAAVTGATPEPDAAPAPDAGAAPTETPSPEPSAVAPEPAATGTGDYDFTKDFKEFEDTVNKSKADAKKKFLDKMNASVVGKKVTVNASRGYGQPQKDYTIDKVSKGSVDWYYNKNVVVLTDSNGKEYFLTPGVNIKIEPAGSPDSTPAENPQEPAPGAAPSKPEDSTPTEPQAPGAEPAPSTQVPAEPKAEVPPSEPQAAAVPAPEVPPTPDENPEDKEKKLKESKKTKTVRDIQLSLSEFLVNESTDLSVYIKGPKTSINESKNRVLEFVLEVPKNIFNNKVGLKEMKLNLVNGLRNRFQPSKNIVEIESVGRNYVFTIIKELV